MSILYDFQVEVNNLPRVDTDAVMKKIGDIVDREFGEGSENSDCYGSVDEIAKVEYSGQTKLCGGESTEDAHNRVKAAILKDAPNVAVITRWHYAEWDWDDIFGEDEEEE